MSGKSVAKQLVKSTAAAAIVGVVNAPLKAMRQAHFSLVERTVDLLRPDIEAGMFADMRRVIGAVRTGSALEAYMVKLERKMAFLREGYFAGPDAIDQVLGWRMVFEGHYLLEQQLELLYRDALQDDAFCGCVAAMSQYKPDEGRKYALKSLAYDVCESFFAQGGRIAILENNPDWRAGGARKAVA